MTATALETVVGAHRPLTRHGLLCLGAGAVCVLSGLGWLTLVLEGRSGAVVSISLGAFSNQDEMLDAIRRRLEAAGGLPVEVVPA